jgi:beta-lactamase superfamily II metal-dependent hydrolase
MDVWVMDIGQGACIIVDCPNTDAMLLVDCGSDRGSRRITSPKVGAWVNAKLATKPFRTLVISHPHTDHYRMFSSGVIKPERIDQAFLGGARDQYNDPTKATHRPLNDFLLKIGGRQDPVLAFPSKTFIADDTRMRCAPATVDVLTSSVAETARPRDYESLQNANSVVLRISYAGRSIVLPGDAESITQASALANAAANGLSLAQPTVVVASHHGSETHGSNDEDWRKAWTAPIVVFSANIEHVHGHPVCERLTEYAKLATPTPTAFDMACGQGQGTQTTTRIQARLVETYDNGHIRLRFGPDGIRVDCQILTPACDGLLPKSELPKS